MPWGKIKQKNTVLEIEKICNIQLTSDMWINIKTNNISHTIFFISADHCVFRTKESKIYINIWSVNIFLRTGTT